jgi:hypothetical protein
MIWTLPQACGRVCTGNETAVSGALITLALLFVALAIRMLLDGWRAPPPVAQSSPLPPPGAVPHDDLLVRYGAVKQLGGPVTGSSNEWALYQEALLSLEVAEQLANPAAAYRGLECLRRLRLSPGFQDAAVRASIDPLESRFRTAIAAFSAADGANS